MTDIIPSVLTDAIPARLSAVEDHPDFHPVWSRRVRQVYLNNRPVKDVVRFDTAEGWVEYHIWDAKGSLIRHQLGTTGWLTTKRETGTVRATFYAPEGV